uniref:WAT1-related protein n=1 Tax=Opuntia streptacantha TaxID=393608 RepID=A0A7C9A3C7_OPUST
MSLSLQSGASPCQFLSAMLVLTAWSCWVRMEKLDWRNLTCLAKLVGTIVSIGGAFVATLYQGPPLLALFMPADTHLLNVLGGQSKWVLGGFVLAVDCVLTSSWVIIQAVILKKYPAELIVVFFYCFFVAIQSGVLSLIVKRDPSTWSPN